jgi:hypothetical protein
MGEVVSQYLCNGLLALQISDTAEGATPVTAQAQGTIGAGKSGERWINQPPKGHTTQVVISQVSRTDGAQHEFVLRSFYFGYD